MFQASTRQADIFSTWEDTDKNVLINAVAGSGKTTTLLQILEKCKYKTLFLAFNKSIQEEIQSKITERELKQGKAMTLHSLGLMAIKNKYKRVKINNGKNFDLIKKLQDNEKPSFRKMPWADKLKLSYNLMDMNDISRLFLTDDIEEITNHLVSMDKPLSESTQIEYLWGKFLEIRDATYEAVNLEVDFTDMIYLPVLKDLYIPIDPTYLMIDECQDLNLSQHKLVKNLMDQGNVEKWIAVGDRNQAIYGFSGAYSSSFDLFVEYGNVVELPLDICYRSDSKIILEANKVYNVMQGFSKAPGVVEVIVDTTRIQEKSMVICRNTKPLIGLYFDLLSQGKSAFIKGDDILSGMVRFLKPYKNHTIDSAKVEMMYKIEDLEVDTTDAGKIKTYYFKEDLEKFKLLALHLATPYSTVDFLLNKIETLFTGKEDSIMLCTIHKSKGLEADVVYILNENLIPSKFAKSPEQQKQEQNLRYVARTRAKKELYYLNI